MVASGIVVWLKMEYGIQYWESCCNQLIEKQRALNLTDFQNGEEVDRQTIQGLKDQKYLRRTRESEKGSTIAVLQD